MKRIQIVRKGDEDDLIIDGKTIEERVKSLLSRQHINIPLRTRPEKFLRGFIISNSELYEMQGGVVLYTEIDSLKYIRGYTADIMLLGFEEQNITYQNLRNQLEQLASGNPEGVSKKIKESPLNQTDRLMKTLSPYIDKFKNGKV